MNMLAHSPHPEIYKGFRITEAPNLILLGDYQDNHIHYNDTTWLGLKGKIDNYWIEKDIKMKNKSESLIEKLSPMHEAHVPVELKKHGWEYNEVTKKWTHKKHPSHEIKHTKDGNYEHHHSGKKIHDVHSSKIDTYLIKFHT